MAHKIQIKKEYEEFEIGEGVYRVSLKDEKIKQLAKDMDRLNEDAKTLQGDGVESVDESKKLAIGMFDSMFEKGDGEKIYEACNGSTYSMMGVFRQLIPHIQRLVDDLKDVELKKYTE